MARKRMFDLEIINQESFLDLPMESKALYFLLGMEADDEGFVAPKKVIRLYGGTDDSLRVLIAKNFIIPFSSGVIVITDWKRNNYLDTRRSKETLYQKEKSQLNYNEKTEKYELCSANAQQMLSENRIEESSIEQNRIEESSIVDIVEQILDYLNLKTSKHFKKSSTKTQKLIKARLNEGYKLIDFKRVIDIKTKEWLNDDKMNTYLRPETLFSNKFEGYLNQKEKELTTKDVLNDRDWSVF